MPPKILRRLPALVASAAALAAAGPAASAGAATTKSTSTNWAGYAVTRSGVKFKRVSATWIQPKATCTDGRVSYAAVWVGLGGYKASSKALEQIGTEADCTAAGKVRYSAWWEIVPDVAKTIDVTVKPGDRIRASVTVSGKRVTLRLANTTRGKSFTTTQTADAVDLTSAEWIVEAPSACYDAALSDCQVLPLANFGSATFSNAKATSAGGYVGGIEDDHWSAVAISLSSSGGRRFAGPQDAALASAAGATPGELSTNGSSFSVTYDGSGSSAGGGDDGTVV